jgi:hypothetical protein
MDKRYGPTYTSLHQSYEEQRNVHTEKYIVNTGTQGTPKQYNLIVMGAKKILDRYLNGSTSYRIKAMTQLEKGHMMNIRTHLSQARLRSKRICTS